MAHTSRPVRERPAMNDVAQRAGVSHQTVSRVLNDHPNVRQETRKRVLEAVAELGYRRNSAARALVTHRSATIGIVSSDSLELGPMTTLAILEQSARAAGYFVTVATAPDPASEQMAAVVESLMDQAVEGVVVIAPVERAAQAAQAISAEVPVLLLATVDQAEFDLPVLSVDQGAGVELLIRHLLELGHRDLVHIAGPPQWFDAVLRSRTWHRVLGRAGRRPRADLPGDWSAASGYAAGRSLLRDPPTAVFAANDQMALGVLHAFAEEGVRVPEDVSVVGFDNAVGSDHFTPSLTTVEQDFPALGQRAIEVLIAMIGGEEVPVRPIAPSLVLRSSTAPPR